MDFLVGKSLSEIESFLEEMGEMKYRGRQIYEWIYVHRIHEFDLMTNLSKSLRSRLSKLFLINPLKIKEINISVDGSKKYLFELYDGNLIESVYIPERNWSTVCISSQVGCALGCKFCATGKMGFIRDLNPGEIVGQLLHVLRKEKLGKRRINVVFMGMGEPLLNFENVMAAYSLITDPEGISISRRRVTISTAGIIPSLERLKEMDKLPKLAISLNGATDDVRSFLMPVNKKYPLKELVRLCKNLPLQRGERITFEYVLFKDINDALEDAKRLAGLLHPGWAKVNLIPYNPIGEELHPSPIEKILRFQEFLLKRGFVATIRDSKGRDISGACGMLAANSK